MNLSTLCVVALGTAALLARSTLEARGADGLPVHILTPGFEVEEVPVKLSNQNNLRFAPDGTLTGLGYDGKIWRIRDTNGDGMEDTAEEFWSRQPLSVPVGMEWGEDGLYVSSKGKVSRFVDSDRDGRADREEVVVSGWPTRDAGSGGVDATSVTLDGEQNVYFGLLVSDYANAYRLRKRSELKPGDFAILVAKGIPTNGPPDETVSIYEPSGVHGTIQKWHRKSGRLETLATGIRVPYGLQFNAAGDLFNTDQEGETWMPDGNPLDELNHIVSGRNYGFPPPHPKWLAGGDPEPPVAGFGPQHQSSCGFVFNEAAPARKGGAARGHFGPPAWKGEALVTGESRGQIWRVQLAKTLDGYVSRIVPFARLEMLTTDVTISPKGDLYVSCHSGLPDWGTGPSGQGRLFRIRYTRPEVPQPIGCQLVGANIFQIIFDRPVDESIAGRMRNREISLGGYISAGDEWETLKPPYEVVKQQGAAPRTQVRILEAELGRDGVELILRTEPLPVLGRCVVRLEGVKSPGIPGPGEAAQMEYDFSGVVSGWSGPLLSEQILSSDSRMPLMGEWLNQMSSRTLKGRFTVVSPHPDPKVIQSLEGHANGVSFRGDPKIQEQAGRQTTAFRLRLPRDVSKLRFRASQPFFLSGPVAGSDGAQVADGVHELVLNNPRFPPEATWSLHCAAIGGRRQGYEVAYQTASGSRWRTAPTGAFVVPWAPVATISSGTASREDSGTIGDWEQGRELFFGPRILCSTCHQVRGEGALTGPDLSNLIHRDRGTILRDIREPNATMHPDYVTYELQLSGDVVSGFVRPGKSATELVLFDGKGGEQAIHRSDIREMHPTGLSLMPSGLIDGLKESEVNNLLTFLRHSPPERPPGSVTVAPKAPDANAPIRRIVLVASKQDHGPGQHAYPAWQSRWVEWLKALRPRDIVETAWEWPTPEQWKSADVVICYFWNHDWNQSRLAELDSYQSRGGGLVMLHSAVISDNNPEALAERIGLAAHPKRTGYRHMPLKLTLLARADAWVKDIPGELEFVDEPYWPMIGDVDRVNVIAGTRVDGVMRPILWKYSPPGRKGRVACTLLGHYAWTLDDPWFRIMISRALDDVAIERR